MPEHWEDARERRLTEIRSRRGSPERQAAIAAIELAREQERQRVNAQRPRSASTDRKTPENSDSYFGYSWPQWFRMRDAGYDHLLECGRSRRTATYGETWEAIPRRLNEELARPWRALSYLLGAIAVRGHADLHVIPTAIVVHQSGDNNPGGGFFRLAIDLGELSPAEGPPEGEDFVMTERQRQFWMEQVELFFHCADG